MSAQPIISEAAHEINCSRNVMTFYLLIVMRLFLAFRAKKPLHTGVLTGRHYLTSLSVCACVKFVVSTDCESCTWSIPTSSGSMESGEYGLTRRTCFFSRRPEVVAVAGLMKVSWCVFSGAGLDFFVLSMSFHFQNPRPRAVSLESVKGLRKPANLPTDNSRPPIRTRCTV